MYLYNILLKVTCFYYKKSPPIGELLNSYWRLLYISPILEIFILKCIPNCQAQVSLISGSSKRNEREIRERISFSHSATIDSPKHSNF